MKSHNGKRLRADEWRWFDWLRIEYSSRGMTLGRGRPHDDRILRALEGKGVVKKIGRAQEYTSSDFAVLDCEDQYGIALMRDAHGTVFGAEYYGCVVRRFCDEDYQNPEYDLSAAIEHGWDTVRDVGCDTTTERAYWLAIAHARGYIECHSLRPCENCNGRIPVGYSRCDDCGELQP